MPFEREGASNSLLQTIYDHVDISVFVVEVLEDGDYLYAGINKTHEQLVGLTNDQVVGKRPQDLEEHFGAEAVQGVLDLYDRCVQSREPVVLEHTAPIRGIEEWWLSTIKPLFDDDGRVHRLVGNGVIITEHKARGEALRASEARYRTLFEQSNDAVFIHRNGHIQEVNQRAVELTGHSRDELMKMTIWDLSGVPPTERKSNAVDTVMREGSTRFEGQFIHKDEHVVDVEVSSRLIDAETMTIQGVARDVTDRKRIEAQLLQSQKLQALGTLAGGVAHDMNNVLTVVLGLSTVLAQDVPADDPAATDLQHIMAAARRGRSLVENLLGFARKRRYKREKLSLDDTLASVLAILLRSFPKGITIESSLNDSGALVECDEPQLVQALLNVCLNARDALPEGGTLKITSTREIIAEGDRAELFPGWYAKVEIRDDGVGMDPETVTRALEPFFTTKDVGKGTGLGLAMVYGVISDHGGTVAIESTPGHGTTVSLWLPEIEHAPVKPSKWIQHSEPARGVATLLLVDDERLVRRAGRRALERLGYQVLEASDGAAALEVFEASLDLPGTDIALVLLDLSMPGMDGYECLSRLRQLDPNVPVFVCTGHGLDSTVKPRLEGLVTGIVTKPFDMRALGKVIASALRK